MARRRRSPGRGDRPSVAELNDRLVRSALALAVSSLETEGHGRPPVPFTWLPAGSEGRREQALRTDQDNALVYRDPPPGLEPAAGQYFERLAAAMSASLARLGPSAVPGGIHGLESPLAAA